MADNSISDPKAELCSLSSTDITPPRGPREIKALQRHYHCAITLARQSAFKVVKTKLQAQGLRLSAVPMRDISAMANQYLAMHRDQLLQEARELIARSPHFARWRLPR